METVVYVLMVLAVIFWVSGISLLIRNDQIHDFLLRVSNLCHSWNMRHIEEEESAYEWAFNKFPEYPKVLYSFKRLKLESWLSKELIDKLMT